MKIDKIIKMKDNKYKIYIDGESYITYDNVILDNELLYKKNIDNVLFNKIIVDTSYYNIYNKTIKYILKKRRSKLEIIKYLSKFELKNSDIDKMITKLEELNLINDIEYCKAYINDKIYLSKTGINRIRIDLLEQNIPIEIIDRELNNIDKDIVNKKLEKLILKRLNSNNKYSNNFIKQKIINEMINLGYSKDAIIEIIEKNINLDNDVLKKEFNKIYNKLSKKYNGIELNNKLKQKLLLKGFNLNKINELVQQKTED